MDEENLIRITNENFKDYLGLDIEYALCISSGAQGPFGTFQFWTSDGNVYGGSFLYGIDWDNLIQVVPVFSNTVEGFLFDGEKVAEGWIKKAVGPGWSAFVRREVLNKYF